MRYPSEGRGGWQQRPPARLLSLNRHSLTALLVTGGQAEHRRAVALSFHDAGPLRGGPFVHVDCRRDESRLQSALEGCLTGAAAGSGPSVVLAAWGGTLYLDRVAALTLQTQKLAQCALHRACADESDGWPLRISAGDDEDPAVAVRNGRFLPGLYDALDKIRVELDPGLRDALGPIRVARDRAGVLVG